MKHVRRHKRFQQHRDASCHQVSFFLQDKAPKKIHAILVVTLGEHAPLYATVKNWVAQFKRGDFSTCDAPCPGRPKIVNMPEIIDHIHELILEDCRISAKSIAEQLGISREWVGSIIRKDLDLRKLSSKWAPKCLKVDQKRQRCQSSEQIRNFFDTIQIISRWARLVTMDETWLYHYDPETNNKQWSGGIAAHPAPKYSECKKFSPRFLGIKTASPSLIISQRAKISTRSVTHLCWCN